MLNRRIITLFLIIIGIFFVCSTQKTFTAGEPIGTQCTDLEGSECFTGECQESDLPAPNNKYCVCGDDEDCATRYGGAEDNWTCKDTTLIVGTSVSHNLNYCLSKLGSSRVEYPAGAGSVNIIDAVLDTEASIQAISEADQLISKPQPRIEIPGLTFSEISKETDSFGNIWLQIPYLGEYIGAIYKYLIIVGVIFVIVMFIQFGLEWTQSGGGEGKQKAMKKMQSALVGLILLLGSYIILWTINPKLVKFENLKVLYVKEQPLEIETPLYSEAPDQDYETEYDTSNVSSVPFTGGTDTIQSPGKKTPNCLIDTFSPGQTTGKRLPEQLITTFDLFNMSTDKIDLKKRVKINVKILDALQQVNNEVLASTDPELKGYLQYMRDYRDGKVPNISGGYTGKSSKGYDGDGIFSTSLRDSRGTYDTHTLGIAIDIFPPNNWDLHTDKYTGGKGKPAEPKCKLYKEVFQKMKSGTYDNKDKNGNVSGVLFSQDPYKMFNRIEKKINNCLNQFDGYKDPWTTLPDEMVRIFQKHGFYWAGYGWAQPGKPIVRTDSMHFEYYGTCAKW